MSVLVSLPLGGVVRVCASAGSVQATLLCEHAGQLSPCAHSLHITAVGESSGASLVPLVGGLARCASGRRAAHLVLLERSAGATQLHFGELAADSSAASGLAWRCSHGAALAGEVQEASLAAGCFVDGGPFFLAALPELCALLVCAPAAPPAANSHLVARLTPPADVAAWRLALLRFHSPPLLLHAGWGLCAAVPGEAALLRLPASEASPACFTLVPLHAALSPASHSQQAQLSHFEHLAAGVAPAELASLAVCAAAQPDGGLALLLRDGEGTSLTLVQLCRGGERSRRMLFLRLDEQRLSDPRPAVLLQLPSPGLEEEEDETEEEEALTAALPTPPLLLLAHPDWAASDSRDAFLLDLSPRAALAEPLLPIATHIAAAIPLAGREAGLLLLPALGASEGETVAMVEGPPPASPVLPMLRALPGCLGAAQVLSTVRATRACAGAAALAGGEGVAAVAAALSARVEEAEEVLRSEHARVRDKMTLLDHGRAVMASCESAPPPTSELQLAGGFSGGRFHVWATGSCAEGSSLLLLPVGAAAARLSGCTSTGHLRASVPAVELAAAQRVAVLLCTPGEGAPMLTELGELPLEWGAEARGLPPSAAPPATRSLLLLGSTVALRRLPRQLCDALGLEGEPGSTSSASLSPLAAHPFLPPHARLVVSLPRDCPDGGAEATALLSAADEGSLALLSGALLPALERAGVRAAPLRSSAPALEAARLCADTLAAELRAEDEETGDEDVAAMRLRRMLLQADTDAACAAMLLAAEGPI